MMILSRVHSLFLTKYSLSMFPTTDYYMSMAPLVLEESRCIIAESLINISRTKQDGYTFSLELLSIEEKYQNIAQRKNAPMILNFQIVATDSLPKKQRYNSDISAKWIRPGCVLLLRCQGKHISVLESSVLACTVPNGNRQSESNSLLSLMIFRRDDVDFDSNSDKKLFCAASLTTLILQVRQMEACLRMYKVSFMRKLLGQKKSSHIRFNSSDEDDVDEVVLCDGEADVGRKALREGTYIDSADIVTSSSSSDTCAKDSSEDFYALIRKIPKLNETQEIAARMFLDSPKESLILVQG